MHTRAFAFFLKIDPVEAGKLYDIMPLHCTLMHWFHTTTSGGGILRAAEYGIGLFRPIELISRKPALFGRDKNIPVHVVIRTIDLICLHQCLFRALVAHKIQPLEPDFIGAGYQPHVTTASGVSFPPGSHHVSREVLLIEAGDPVRLRHKYLVGSITLR